jgi:hypothetical protein
MSWGIQKDANSSLWNTCGGGKYVKGHARRVHTHTHTHLILLLEGVDGGHETRALRIGLIVLHEETARLFI